MRPFRRRARSEIQKVIWYLDHGIDKPFPIYEDCEPSCADQCGTPVHVGLCAHRPIRRGQGGRHPLQFRFYKRKLNGQWL